MIYRMLVKLKQEFNTGFCGVFVGLYRPSSALATIIEESGMVTLTKLVHTGMLADINMHAVVRLLITGRLEEV